MNRISVALILLTSLISAGAEPAPEVTLGFSVDALQALANAMLEGAGKTGRAGKVCTTASDRLDFSGKDADCQNKDALVSVTLDSGRLLRVKSISESTDVDFGEIKVLANPEELAVKLKAKLVLDGRGLTIAANTDSIPNSTAAEAPRPGTVRVELSESFLNSYAAKRSPKLLFADATGPSGIINSVKIDEKSLHAGGVLKVTDDLNVRFDLLLPDKKKGLGLVFGGIQFNPDDISEAVGIHFAKFAEGSLATTYKEFQNKPYAPVSPGHPLVLRVNKFVVWVYLDLTETGLKAGRVFAQGTSDFRVSGAPQ